MLQVDTREDATNPGLRNGAPRNRSLWLLCLWVDTVVLCAVSDTDHISVMECSELFTRSLLCLWLVGGSKSEIQSFEENARIVSLLSL